MVIKPPLSSSKLDRRRCVIGIVAGVVFAASFYLASITVARSATAIMRGMATADVARAEDQNSFAEEYGLPLRPVPTVIGPAEATTPRWAEPFWAGLAAVFGQAIAFAIWFVRPQAPWSLRRKRAGLHARSGAATGLMWIGLVPLLLVEIWFQYLIHVYAGNIEGSAFGYPVAPDPLTPFFPFGMGAMLLVLLLALEPWRSMQRVYRCGWWPVISASITILFAAVLFFVYRWLATEISDLSM